jgi:hypothetical protein
VRTTSGQADGSPIRQSRRLLSGPKRDGFGGLRLDFDNGVNLGFGFRRSTKALNPSGEFESATLWDSQSRQTATF